MDQLQPELNNNSFSICELHQKCASLLTKEYDVKMLIEKKRRERLEESKKKQFGFMKSLNPKLDSSVSISINCSTSQIRHGDSSEGFDRSEVSGGSPKKSALMRHIERLEGGFYSFTRE